MHTRDTRADRPIFVIFHTFHRTYCLYHIGYLELQEERGLVDNFS